jgi:PAS domain S-box-containing protein
MNPVPPDAGDANGNRPERSTRPLLAGLLAILLLASVGMGIGIYQLRQMGQTLESLMREEDAARGAIVTMLRTARERMLTLDEAIGMEDAFERDERLLRFEQLAGEFGAARQRLAALPLSPMEQAVQARQGRLILDLIGHFDQIVRLARQDDLAAARELLQHAAIPAQSRMLDALMEWVEIRQARQGARAENARAHQQRAVALMFGVGVASIVLGLLVAMLVYRWNTRLIGRLTDNQARLRAALAEQAFQRQALDEHSIVSVTDAGGHITDVNDKFREVSGYSREDLIGSDYQIIKSGFHPPEFFQTLWDTISAGKVWRGEVKNRAKDGRLYWVETTIVPMLDEHGQPMRYISVCTEITHIMELEEAVRQANVILQGNVIERTHELELAKQQLEQELADRVRTQAALQNSYDELRGLHRQLQEAQQYLMQSEKLAAVGQLAAGMAHEINNPIGFVSSNLAMLSRYQDSLAGILSLYREVETGLGEEPRARIAALRQKIDLDFVLEDTRALLEETRAGIERVRKIVQDLRDFSRVDSAGQRQWVDINQSLDTTLKLLGERLADNVEIQREYGQLPQVECNPAELNQVFFNLLNNALQALQALPQGGRVTLRSGMDDARVWVEIEDNGVGIAEADLPHIFDPFFTTRPVGQGAGLGLSMAYGVVQQHQGRISVDSMVGRGSLFRVTLPIQQSGDTAGESDGKPIEGGTD